MAHGPAPGLAVVDSVAEQLKVHYRLDSVRAHLLEMSGDNAVAREHYRAAASRATNLCGAALPRRAGGAARIVVIVADVSDRPTIRDVAREARVSIATVSRALNDKDDVSVATRERVREAAQ